jgi:uroporphyrinogen decarboxylase
MHDEPLTRDEVKSVIEGHTHARRVPMFIHFWTNPDAFGDRKEAVKNLLGQYPQDMQVVPFFMPSQYRGGHADPCAGQPQVAIDSAVAIADWSRLDDILSAFPRPDRPDLFARAPLPDGRYRLAHWFFCLFERHWSLRGMTNALLDYYEHPDEVHRLFDALTTFYCGLIERAAREQQCDGLWTSDDLGTQTAGFFSTAIFDEFFKPYYKRMFDACHRNGMHAWMHACGCLDNFIPGWLDIGLDVLHPIQKHTMDERAVAAKFGSRLTILAGLDVQQVIPWGTPDDVRREVRFLMDTYWRPGEGRCMITAGNGITGDCTVASLEAFLDETFHYGKKVASR